MRNDGSPFRVLEYILYEHTVCEARRICRINSHPHPVSTPSAGVGLVGPDGSYRNGSNSSDGSNDSSDRQGQRERGDYDAETG